MHAKKLEKNFFNVQKLKKKKKEMKKITKKFFEFYNYILYDAQPPTLVTINPE